MFDGHGSAADNRSDASSEGTSPRITIGIPVFNGAEYIGEAVQSILDQTYSSFQIVISDNGSTDRTEQICRELEGRDRRIKYIRQPFNRGAAWNYNFVFHYSKSELFKWASHDDVLCPDFLARCVRLLDENQDCVLAHPRTLIIDADGKPEKCYLDYIASGHEDPSKRFAQWILPRVGMCNPVFGVIRRRAMQTTGLHGDYLEADRVFLAELTLRGKILEIPETLFLRRVHAEMSGRAYSDEISLQQWFDGRPKSVLVFRYWRRLREYVRAVRRANLPAGVRLRCYGVLASWFADHVGLLARELCIPIYANGKFTRSGRVLMAILATRIRLSTLRNLPRKLVAIWGPRHRGLTEYQ